MGGRRQSGSRFDRGAGEGAEVSATEERGAPAYPLFPETLPADPIRAGRYTARFARTQEELEAVQRLRFEVFNLELGEGLEESFATGRDEDRYDPVCHHLVVRETVSGEVIGTYRMQTSAMARRLHGFYAAEEFDLRTLPEAVVARAIEVGRACVARPYRNRQVLFLLWKGLAAYLQRNGKTNLFGCCSLTSQDPAEGKRVMEYLEAEGHVHPKLRVVPQEGWACYAEDFRLDDSARHEPVRLPKLFSLYLRYGAKVLGPPAIDRSFKTIDYFVVLDVEDLGTEARNMFFG